MNTTPSLSGAAVASSPHRSQAAAAERSSRAKSVVNGFPDSRKGPIPSASAPPAWKGPLAKPDSDVEQRAEVLLKKFSKGVVRPDAHQPDTLFAPGRSGKLESLLITFCRAASAKAHGFLTKVLLPAVESLAQRMDVAKPVGEKEPIDWKRAAGGHLIAGANAALRANNPKALEALVPVAMKHFPDDVIPFIESRLKQDPSTARTFAAAGVDAGTLEGLLARVTAHEAERPAAAVAAAGSKVDPAGGGPLRAAPAQVHGPARAPAQASARAPARASAQAQAPARAPAVIPAAASAPAPSTPPATAPSPFADVPTVEF